MAYLWGTSGVVNGTRHENFPLAIDDYGLSIVSYTALGKLRT